MKRSTREAESEEEAEGLAMAIMKLGTRILRLALVGALASGAFGIAFAQEQPSAARWVRAPALARNEAAGQTNLDN
jgi:hypothetical protein